MTDENNFAQAIAILEGNVVKLGPLIVDIPGYELTGDDKEVLNHPLVGGVYCFQKFSIKNQIAC